MNADASERALMHWVIQRATAAIIAMYTVFAAGMAVVATPIAYESWTALFSTATMKAATAIFALALAAHAAIGFHDVLRDYVHRPSARRVLLGAAYLLLAAFVVQMFTTLWS